MKNKMIPVGYMAKVVRSKPEGEGFEGVEFIDIYSVSPCLSKDFADYIQFWQHNGYWFFDSPKIIQHIAQEHSIDLSATKIFYYEVFEKEFDQDAGEKTFKLEASFKTNVDHPRLKQLEGFDVVSFSTGSAAGCSPLSCNYLANEINVNQHCLLSSFKEAHQLLQAGKFSDAEPGPYRIFAVYSVEWA